MFEKGVVGVMGEMRGLGQGVLALSSSCLSGHLLLQGTL